jgi:hypothetical protein
MFRVFPSTPPDPLSTPALTRRHLTDIARFAKDQPEDPRAQTSRQIPTAQFASSLDRMPPFQASAPLLSAINKSGKGPPTYEENRAEKGHPLMKRTKTTA